MTSSSALTLMPLVDDNRRQDVAFPTEGGLRLAGHLYAARGPSAASRNAALVMTGPMTSVKEETLPHYSEALEDCGFTVLTFDNRNFGESDGTATHPRRRRRRGGAGRGDGNQNLLDAAAAKATVNAEVG